jgi:hypothetical protein
VIAPTGPRRSAPSGGLAVLVVVTVLAALAAPQAKALYGLLPGGPTGIARPAAPHAPAIRRPALGPTRAVAFALAQRGKPYRWGPKAPAPTTARASPGRPGRRPGWPSPGPRPASWPASPASAVSSNRATW